MGQEPNCIYDEIGSSPKDMACPILYDDPRLEEDDRMTTSELESIRRLQRYHHLIKIYLISKIRILLIRSRLNELQQELSYLNSLVDGYII